MDNNLDINAFLLKALLNNGSMPRVPGILGELEQQITSSLRKLMNIEDTQSADLNSQMSTLKNDIAQKNSIIAEFSKQIMDFKTATSQKDDVISTNARQLSEARASVSQKETSIADMSKQIIDLGLTKSRNEMLVSELRTQNDAVISDCLAKDTVIANLTGELTKIKGNYQRVVLDMSSDTKRADDERETHRRDVDKLTRDNEMLRETHRGEVEKLTRDNEMLRDTHSRELEKMSVDNGMLRETHRRDMEEQHRAILEKMADMRTQMSTPVASPNVDITQDEILEIQQHIAERLVLEPKQETSDDISIIFS